jgi:membrane protein implicated in regulation of membrane protease activity
MSSRRRVWVHRVATILCVLLAVPGVLWWSQSVLFVILISLAVQAWTSWGASEAADDRELVERLDRIEALLEQQGADGA